MAPPSSPSQIQSWRSVLVDLALIVAVSFLGIRNVTSAQVWMVLSAMVGARFYASGVRKGSGGSGDGGDPYASPAPGSGDSARRMRALRPEETPPRPPSSLPRAVTHAAVAMILATLYALVIR